MDKFSKLKKSVSIAAGVFAFLGSVIGVIAAFFPNYINLSKEKAEIFSIVIADNSDIKEFESFAERNVGKFVELEILTCVDYPANHCPVISQSEWGIDISYDAETCGLEERNNDSFSINLHESPVKPSIFMAQDNGRCKFNGESSDGNMIAGGYFYIPKDSPYWAEGFKSWDLKRVTEETLMMNR